MGVLPFQRCAGAPYVIRHVLTKDVIDHCAGNAASRGLHALPCAVINCALETGVVEQLRPRAADRWQLDCESIVMGSSPTQNLISCWANFRGQVIRTYRVLFFVIS